MRRKKGTHLKLFLAETIPEARIGRQKDDIPTL